MTLNLHELFERHISNNKNQVNHYIHEMECILPDKNGKDGKYESDVTNSLKLLTK